MNTESIFAAFAGENHIGTAFTIAIGHSLALITAKHVIDDIRNTGDPFQLKNGIIKWSPGHCNWKSILVDGQHIDVAYTIIPAAIAMQVAESTRPMCINDININKTPKGNYKAIGFPAEIKVKSNKKSAPRKLTLSKATPHMNSLGFAEVANISSKERASMLGLFKERTIEIDNQNQTFGSFEGMSGGVLLSDENKIFGILTAQTLSTKGKGKIHFSHISVTLKAIVQEETTINHTADLFSNKDFRLIILMRIALRPWIEFELIESKSLKQGL